MPITGSFSVDAVQGSFDEYMKSFLNRATGPWVAVLLERAQVVELDRDRPARMRLTAAGSQQPPSVVGAGTLATLMRGS